MTARERLMALRTRLLGVLTIRAVLVGLGAALATRAALGVTVSPYVATGVAIVAGAAVAAALLRPARAAASPERVALWVEEHHPALRYALVTAATSSVPNPELEGQALALPWWDARSRDLWRALVIPALVAVSALALLIVAPAIRRVAAGRSSSATRGKGAAGALVNPFARISVRVTPPGYAHRSGSELDDPATVEALAGSVVLVSGDAGDGTVRASVDSVPRAAITRDGRWTLRLPMPAHPALLRLADDRGHDRLVILAPVADAAPAVTLLLPARDTIVRTATGTILLRAQLRDDIGLRDASFEVVVSSGQEENFTFRTTALARTTLGGATEHVLQARLSLDSLALKPGDMVQLRAVARDGNTVTGPGIGSSDTRALRVARAGEYDSVSVEAAPPGEEEGQVLSQRMLITLTEALEKRRPSLARETLLAESRRIAGDQARLRKRVSDVVFQRTGGEPLTEETSGEEARGKLTPEEVMKAANAATSGNAGEVMDVEGDETPILAINKPLLEAYNAMWDAGRSLEQGETRQALPPMRRALAAIERAREAERIYLRGRPSAVIVDVARARLAGKDKGTAGEREPRAVLDPVERRRAQSFTHATALLARDPAAAADTLLVMRVQALGSAPALASALDEASRAIRRGDKQALSAAWQRLRRALAGEPVHATSLPLWSGAP